MENPVIRNQSDTEKIVSAFSHLIKTHDEPTAIRQSLQNIYYNTARMAINDIDSMSGAHNIEGQLYTLQLFIEVLDGTYQAHGL